MCLQFNDTVYGPDSVIQPVIPKQEKQQYKNQKKYK